jgi:hypothetical protein
MNRRARGVSEAYAERRRREDEAPRLRSVIPTLKSLRLEIKEHRGDALVSEACYIRRVVVESAAALFFIPCTDPACREGGHDLSAAILRSLEQGSTEFQGTHRCGGVVGTGECARVLHYTATAEYGT